jgi:hypothetical protein
MLIGNLTPAAITGNVWAAPVRSLTDPVGIQPGSIQLIWQSGFSVLDSLWNCVGWGGVLAGSIPNSTLLDLRPAAPRLRLSTISAGAGGANGYIGLYDGVFIAVISIANTLGGMYAFGVGNFSRGVCIYNNTGNPMAYSYTYIDLIY